MEQEKRNRLILNLVFIVFGAAIIINPAGTVVTVLRIAGLVLLIMGIIGILKYWKADPIDRNFGRMVIAVLEAIIGLIFLATPRFIVSIFPLVMGVVILAAGLYNLYQAYKLKQGGYDHWKTGMAMPVLTTILGIIVICNPFSTAILLMRIVGIVLVYKGITGLIMLLMGRDLTGR